MHFTFICALRFVCMFKTEYPHQLYVSMDQQLGLLKKLDSLLIYLYNMRKQNRCSGFTAQLCIVK